VAALELLVVARIGAKGKKARLQMLFRQSRQLIKFLSDATYRIVGTGIPGDQYPEIVRELHEEIGRHLHDFHVLSDLDEERLFQLADSHIRSKIRLTMEGVIRIDEGPSGPS
jgi:hypothetical protein